MKIVLMLLCALSLFGSEPEFSYPAEALKVATSNFVVPKVDVISGTYIEDAIDLIIPGDDPLSLRRFYYHSAPHYDTRYGFWQFNPEAYLWANLEFGRRSQFAAIGDQGGGITSTSRQGKYVFGVSNNKGEACGGSGHPCNLKLTYQKVHQTDERFLWQGEVSDGSGSRRYFKSGIHHWHKTNKRVITEKERFAARIGPSTWIPYELPIQKEVKPNGNILVYKTQEWRSGEMYPSPRLFEEISLQNRRGEELAHLRFSYRTYPWKLKSRRVYGSGLADDVCVILRDVESFEVEGSDGRKVAYTCKKRKRDIEPVVLTSVKTPASTYRLGYHGYQLTNLEKDGYLFRTEYDDQRRVVAQYTPAGCLARFAYKQNQTIVTDGEGHVTRYHYDTRIKRIELEDSIEIREWEQESGNLLAKTIKDRAGRICYQQSFTYDKNHNPITETIGDHTIYRCYSDDGFNLLLEEQDGDKITRMTYLPGTNLMTSKSIYDKDCLKKKTTYVYDCAVCIKTIEEGEGSYQVTQITPEKSGLPKVVENETGKVIYTYTPFGKVLREEHFDATGAYCYTISNTYDERERLTGTTNALGETTTYAYDERNNLISTKNGMLDQTITYDAANRPIKTTTNGLTIEHTYDTLGRLITEVDPSGFATKYTYNAAGKVTSILHPDGAKESFEYDPLGNIIKYVDPNNFITETSYNFHSKPVKIKHPDGTVEIFTYRSDGSLASHTTPNGTTCYKHDIFGNVIETIQKEKVSRATFAHYGKLSETDALGVTTTYEYDTCGRLVKEHTAERVITYHYDARGRLAETHSGDIYSIETFDDLDRLLSKESNHSYETYTYDILGNQTSITNSKGTAQTFYNAHSRPIKAIDPLGNITAYHYDYTGGLTVTLTDPSGLESITKYDACGRAVEEVCGEQIKQITYDLAGNPTSVCCNGITHTTTYGPRNRVESFCEAGSKTTQYIYDRSGHLQTLIKPHATFHHTYDIYGRLHQFTGPDFDYIFTYDLLDRVIAVNDGTVRTYDIYGNLTQETLANGLTLTNTYDPQGRRTALTLPDHSHITYAYQGNYLIHIRRNGYTHTYTRDRDGHIIASGSLNITRDALGRPTLLSSPHYTSEQTYDACGNISRLHTTDPLGCQTLHFTYDKHHRLVQEYAHAYSYDPLSNRIAKDHNTSLYDDHCQETTQSYDLAGNLLLDNFSYDSLGRLIATPGTTYTYDAFHRRISDTHNTYIWDDKLEIGTQDTLRVLGDGLGADIGAAILLEIKNTTYIPIHNSSGSLALLINPANNTTETYRYTAYGEPLTPAATSPWRYCSKRTDPTGLIYFGRRYYHPSLGRWLTPDPTGFKDGPNPYAYANNNPLTYIDLHGLAVSLPLSSYDTYVIGKLYGHYFESPFYQSSHLQRCGDGSGTYSTCTYSPHAKIQAGFTNGINTPYPVARDHANCISSLGGMHVAGTHMPTRGPCHDVMNASKYLRGETTPGAALHHQWNVHFLQNPGTPYLQFCHSNGATIVRNQLKDYSEPLRNKIRIVAIAPASYIDRDLCQSVVHYTSSRDFVPRIDKKGRKIAKKQGTIVKLRAHSNAPVFDHSFQSPTYRDSIEYEIRSYKLTIGYQ